MRAYILTRPSTLYAEAAGDPQFALRDNHRELVLTARGNTVPAEVPVVLRNPMPRQLRQLAYDLCECAERMEHDR